MAQDGRQWDWMLYAFSHFSNSRLDMVLQEELEESVAASETVHMPGADQLPQTTKL